MIGSELTSKDVIFSAENLHMSFQERPVLDSVHLKLFRGEFLCILGASGCGKSTLLRLTAGLEKPTGGQVHWPAETRRGFVFQEAHLLSWRNALENALLPLELQRELPPSQQRDKALWALRRVGLEKAVDLFPHQLSGGMKMRVSIARALASAPQVLFLDEPFSALDEGARFALQTELRRLCEEEGLSVVFVTHSSSEAAFLADRVLVMGPQGGLWILQEEISYEGESRDENLRTDPRYLAVTEKISRRLRGGQA